jgi:hypothetical protein
MKHSFSIDLGNRVHRRYLIELVVAMAFYAAAVALARWLEGRVGHDGWFYVVSLLPMLPIGYVIVAVFRYLTDCDELERHIVISSLAITFCATAFASLAYGFLEGAGLPRLSMFSVWQFMGVCWIISTLALRMRYR